MTLYSKAIMIIGATTLGLILLLYFVSQTILLRSFVELEERTTSEHVGRALNAIGDQSTDLGQTVRDWGIWDETYDFVQNPGPEYIENNLQDTAFGNLDVNLLLYLNPAGEISYGDMFDFEQETKVELPAELRQAAQSMAVAYDGEIEIKHGIILLPKAPFLFAAGPILHNDTSGPAAGTLVVGRYLDESRVAQLAESTRLAMSLHRLDIPAATLPPDLQAAQAALSAEGEIFVRPLDEQQIAGYTLVTDLEGQPAFLLKVELAREIYAQGHKSLSYFIWSLVGSGLIFSVIVVLLLNRQVLLRLTRLSHAVYRIEHGQDTVRQVPVEGRDELTSLSVAINNMLTALGRSESALAEARDQALEASRFKSQLLASVSHDLRSPLNAILGYAEILGEEIEGPLADEHQEMIRRIITSAGHLLALINNLLNEAQLEAGKITLSIASFPPDELLESVQMTMLILAQAKGLTLRGEVDPDLPARLSGDAHWLRQIAMNLVSNAIKFTEQGEVCIRLYCVDETHWALQVADTGRGIPPEARTAIFEAFRQVEGTTDRTKGFGLGLSIVNQLTFLMGGQIQLESEVNAGSAFTIILPLTPGDELT